MIILRGSMVEVDSGRLFIPDCLADGEVDEEFVEALVASMGSPVTRR